MHFSYHFLNHFSGQEGFDADYQAVLDRADTQGYTAPSAAQQTLQNQLVKDLKDAGIWDSLDLFYCFANNGSQDFARINWKAPASHEITVVTSIGYDADVGFKGDGAGYLNTSFVPSTDASNATLDSASKFMWLTSNTGTQYLDSDASRNGSWRGGTSQTEYRMHATANAGTALNINQTGLNMMTRNSSTNIKYKDSVNDDSAISQTSATAGWDKERLLLCLNTSLFASSGVQMAFYGYAGDIHSSYSGLNTALNDYLTAI
jgi:hypothetical protein